MSFRLATRALRYNQVRFASTESKASEFTKKATEAATKATSALGNAASKATDQASSAINKASPMLSGLFDKAVHGSKVGLEVAKEVYKREHMAPPNKQQIEQAKEQLSKIFNPEYIKNISITHFYTAAYYGVQIYGFFLVGEIIGRANLVGYNV